MIIYKLLASKRNRFAVQKEPATEKRAAKATKLSVL